MRKIIWVCMGALIAFMLHALGESPPAKIIVVPVMVYERGSLVPADPDMGATDDTEANDCCAEGRNA